MGSALPGLRGRRLATLSGGEKQRVALAAVLAMGPRAAGAGRAAAESRPAATSELFGLLRRLASDGRHSIVIIEHKLDELIDWVDSVPRARGEAGCSSAETPPRLLRASAGLSEAAGCGGRRPSSWSRHCAGQGGGAGAPSAWWRRWLPWPRRRVWSSGLRLLPWSIGDARREASIPGERRAASHRGDQEPELPVSRRPLCSHGYLLLLSGEGLPRTSGANGAGKSTLASLLSRGSSIRRRQPSSWMGGTSAASPPGP